MFTGLVEAQAKIIAVGEKTPRRFDMEIVALGNNNQADKLLSFCEDVLVGDSIACDGCCLTVVSKDNPWHLSFEATYETLSVTALRFWEVGSFVNLEKSLLANQRLGGHFVTGHVDGLGKILAIDHRQQSFHLHIGIEDSLKPYIAARGSVTLQGVSLTVTKLTDRGFEVCLIPFTWDITNLKYLRLEQTLNVEVDLLARYLDQLLRSRQLLGAT